MKVTKIQPKSPMFARKRVSAYARVSDGKRAMLESLSAQVSYYSKLIQSRHEWEFAGVYADEALTGTKQERPELQRLMADCRAGKIDMVITKAISRFARNTVTTLQYVRELREMGIAVYFEEENIDTLTEGGELLLTVLSAYAQEQSLNVSEDCKWRIRKQFENGEPVGAYNVYGYEIKNKQFTIKPDEAETVRFVFDAYLRGMGLHAIRAKLDAAGIPTRAGTPWRDNTLGKMLQNEKYAGDLRLQKTFVADHISKKKRKNNGELPQYYVEDNHEPIVLRAVFDAVQKEMARRSERYRRKPTPASKTDRPAESYGFTAKIVCGGCGKHFRRRTAHQNDKYYNISWQCVSYLQRGKETCMAKKIPEDTLIQIISGLDRQPETITAIYPNTLRFTFPDGSEQETEWRDKSRKWTDDMKARNYENQRRGHKK